MNKHNLILISLLSINWQIMCPEFELAPQEIPDSKFNKQITLDNSNKILISTGLLLAGISLALKKPDLSRYCWVTRRHFDESIKNIEAKMDYQNQLLQIIELKIDLLAKFLHVRLDFLIRENQNILEKIDAQQDLTKLENKQIKDYLVGIDQKINLLVDNLANNKPGQKLVKSSSSVNFFKDY
jgi:hypothetical protein